MRIGYINELAGVACGNQEEALKNLGTTVFYREPVREQISREIFDQMRAGLKSGDTLCLYSLKSLPVATIELIDLCAGFQNRDIEIETVKEGPLDGKTIRIISEFHGFVKSVRSKQGIKSAKARGRKGGRKPGLSKSAKTKAKSAARLYEKGDQSVDEMMSALGIGSRATFYRYLRQAGMEIGGFKKP